MWSALGDEPINRTARWEPEPQIRGTWSILSSCLITLSLCVWTSLHLNLPEPGKTGRQTWRKVGFLAIGLLAPELVALIAYRQWAEQRVVMKKMEEALGDLNPPAKKRTSWLTKLLRLLRLKRKSDAKNARVRTGLVDPERRQHRWSHSHSFLAVMGGFVFDNSHAPKKVPLPKGRQRITLTTRGLVLLAQWQPDLIPDVSEGQIRDKSKTSPLTKTLTCLQALWFCAQVLSRLIEGLAVSLLELNTFAHALCALCIYLIWWNKPLDVVEPFEIGVETERAAALCAAFCNAPDEPCWHPCFIQDEHGNRRPYRQHGLFKARGGITLYMDSLLDGKDSSDDEHDGEQAQEAETDNVAGSTTENPRRSRPSLDSATAHSPLLASSAPEQKPEAVEAVKEKHRETVNLRYKSRKDFFQFTVVRFCAYYSSFADSFSGSVTLPRQTKNGLSIDIKPDFIARAKLMRKLPELRETTDFTDRLLTCFRSCNWIFTRIGDTTGESLPQYLASLALASCVYSAWHLTAWEGPFRGHTEMVLWRGSSIGLGASAVALALAFTVLVKLPKVDIQNGVALLAARTVVLLSITVSVLLALFMVACRLGLVVESFIGVVYLPVNAYQLPSWPAYFPHIG